jgi:large subunit ribosomal protein L31
MKKDIHPKEYRPVIFVDNSSGAQFLISSTIKSKETAKYADGKEYPAVHVEISSASHPFYTNQEKTLDSAGRVEKFKTRQAKQSKSPAKASAKKA